MWIFYQFMSSFLIKSKCCVLQLFFLTVMVKESHSASIHSCFDCNYLFKMNLIDRFKKNKIIIFVYCNNFVIVNLYGHMCGVKISPML